MDKFEVLPIVRSSIADLLETFGIPQRVLLSIFGFLGIINASSLRLCLETTLKEIVNTNCLANAKSKPSTQPLKWTEIAQHFNRTGLSWSQIYDERAFVSLPELKERFRQKFRKTKHTKCSVQNWSKRTQSIIAASFYAGYILSHIPGGVLAQKYGGKWVLALSIIAAAILTILTPWTILNGGPLALIALRVLIGVCEGPAYPALSALLARWIPASERGKLGTFALSGGQMGIVFVNIVSTFVLHLAPWPVVFYFFGACALIWAFSFMLFCSNEPSSDAFIRSAENLYLQESISEIEPTEPAEPTPIPWKQILINVPVWAMISNAIQYNWAQAESMTLMPKFSSVIQEKTLKEDLYASFNASWPHFVNWIISIASGTICDFLVEHNVVSTTGVRKIMASITAFGPKLLNDFSVCVACNQHKDLISKVNCVIGVIGTFCAGVKLTPLDLSPNYAGVLMAISNGIGSLSALILPQIEVLYPNASFYRNLRSALCLISALLTSGEVQNFDQAETDKNCHQTR